MKKLALLSLALPALLAVQTLRADPAENYGKFCASCHGKDGAGKTKAGRLVKVKDLTDAQYQKTFTDDDAFKALKEGFQDKDGNTKMKPFADKLPDDDIKAVVAYVRTLAK
jgi:mono/diheme cytochrome c family protein